MKGKDPAECSRRVEEICHQALDLEPVRRAEFLDQACGGDVEFRREIDSLLTYEAEAEQFLAQSAVRPLPPPQPASAGALVGSQIGPYDVLSCLGSGGMADVYRARDTRLGRDVAIKHVASALMADSSRCARLEREARLLASLNHAHIAAIYDVVMLGGSPALVLELVAGDTLAQRIEQARASGRRALGLEESLSVARQIADAIDAAHRQGIIHCDLKPTNIVVTPQGTAKVLDFGIGRLTGESGCAAEFSPVSNLPEARTHSGWVVGTPAYMSPEQVSGTVDERTDIWAFGCIVYEMLTGRPVFGDGSSPSETLSRVLNDEPAWDALAPDTPRTLRVLLQRCLRKDVHDRLAMMRAALPLLDRARDESTAPALVGSGALDRLRRTRSIAVLPFSNEVADPEAYLGDGIAEGLVQKLSQTPALTVLATSTVRHFKQRWASNPSHAAGFGVQALLAGRIVFARHQLTIDVELVDTVDGVQLWTNRYVHDANDLGGIEEVIAAGVRGVLGLGSRLEDGLALSATHAVRSTAYRQYLKGRYAWNKRTASGFRQALVYFEDATRLDPNYALAFAAIADCHTLLPLYDRGSPEPSYRAAKTAAETALALDDRLAEVHAALGQVHLYYERRWLAAETSLRRAIELAPGSASAHQIYASYLAAVGHLDVAIDECRRALSYDPVSLAINLDLGITLYFAGRNDEAIEQLLATVDLDEHFAPAYAMLGRVYTEAGRLADACAAGEAALARDDAPWVLASLGYTHAVAGETDEARRVAAVLYQRRRRERVAPYDLAVLHALLGDRDDALTLLRAAYDERSGVLVWGLLNDPLLDGLRADPRFVELVHDAGLPLYCP
jgi:serine/threonine-protein kinase